MKQYSKLITWLILATLVVCSCRREEAPIREPKTPTKEEYEGPTPSTPSNPPIATKASRAYINFTTYTDESELLRGLNFVQSERPGKPQEVLPSLSLVPGTSEQVYLILLKEGDANSLHRQVIDFRVLAPQDKRAGGRANVLHYSGAITIPEGYDLSEGRWYAMVILNMDYYNATNQSTNTNGEAGAMVAFGRRSRSGQGQRNISTGDHALIRYKTGTLQPQTYTVGAVPYLSQWEEISAADEIDAGGATLSSDTQTPKSYQVRGLHLKPQGLLMHYVVGVDIAEPMAIRRYGLTSNTLCFSGYYDLDTEALYRCFQTRDQETGIGYPEWTEDPIGGQGLSTHYADPHRVLSDMNAGERAFPWDLPTLRHAQTPMVGEAVFPRNLNLELSQTATTIFPTTKAGQWEFWFTGRDFFSRRSLLFWAMPRKQIPATPLTYLWVGLYPKSYVAPDGFDTKAKLGATVVRQLNAYRQELRLLEHQLQVERQQGNATQHLEASIQSKIESYRPAFEQYTADSLRYYGSLQGACLAERSVLAQPMLILHQSNQTFTVKERQGRTHHIRTLLTGELMLTEQLYHEENGQSYAMVELYNPTTKPLDLNQYALVRLIPHMGSYAYRCGDGTATESLSECVASQGLLELKTLLRPQVLVGKPYSGRSYTVNRGLFSGRKWYTDLWAEQEAEEKSLLPEQTALVASAAYNELYSATTKPTWWLSLEERLQQLSSGPTTRFGQADALRAVVYTTSDILKVARGEGFALLKRYGTKWQVVDATAPIGRERLAFAGSYVAHQQQLNALGATYSLRRRDGVSFPFIPPYRNIRYTNDWSDDWVAESGWGSHTLGLRTAQRASYDRAKGELQVYYPTWELNRTPVDEAYSTYWLNRPHVSGGQPLFPPRSTVYPRPGTPPRGNPNTGNTVSAQAWSASERAGKTWWVDGVNTIAPPVAEWREVSRGSGIKALKWDKSLGWYDLNKVDPYGDRRIDSDLCWAAVAANMIQWWLDQNKSHIDRMGYQGPRTFTSSFDSDIFELYKRKFSNKGGDLKALMDWFFNGKYVQTPIAGGGFFAEVFGEDFKAVEQIGASTMTFSDEVARALKEGAALGCDWRFRNGYLHALTVWGADFDEEGRVTYLYITDSNDRADDEQRENDYVTRAGLLRKAVKLDAGGRVWQQASSGDFSLEITRLYKLPRYEDKWQTYWSGR